MTRKLYYEDAYIKDFSATVVEVQPCADGVLAVLDKTAFFPEEGGQTCDRGYIGEGFVSEVTERDGVIYHRVDRPLAVGDEVECRILFDERYEKMQCHTAEHILCGIIYSLYGLDNVGFHLSRDYVTFDISGPLTREELDRVEDLANLAVSENREVITRFPEESELSALAYRSKDSIRGKVRLVEVVGVDSCACCAPHVRRTGECGVIKILDFEKHKGGVRIYMLAGFKALRDYRARYEATLRISGITSTPQSEIAEEVERLVSENARLGATVRGQGLRIAELLADAVPETEGTAVYFFEDMTAEELRCFVNGTVEKHTGAVVCLSSGKLGYNYVIGSRSLDVSALTREANAALSGKGGGRGGISQGSFNASLSEIQAYFEGRF